MPYKFKMMEEMVWFGLVSAGIAFLEIALRFDAAAIDDWKLWAVSLGGGLVRAFAGGVLAAVASRNES